MKTHLRLQGPGVFCLAPLCCVAVAQVSDGTRQNPNRKQDTVTIEPHASGRTENRPPTRTLEITPNPPEKRVPSRSSTRVDEPVGHERVQLDYDLAGPYNLRSADPEQFGVVELKNVFEWETTRGSDDEFVYEFEIEWGFARNHELIFEVPVETGDGRVQGNGDIELGWHWKLWEEKDWMPAFGMRNFVRLPTGTDSSGVDYEWIGLITKSIIPGKLRFDANPYIKSVNGDNIENARDFLWGASLGLDWHVNDRLMLVGLYRYETGTLNGTRDNHKLEFGGEYEIDEHNEIGFSTEIGLDGDRNGPAFGAKLSYIISF